MFCSYTLLLLHVSSKIWFTWYVIGNHMILIILIVSTVYTTYTFWGQINILVLVPSTQSLMVFSLLWSWHWTVTDGIFSPLKLALNCLHSICIHSSPRHFHISTGISSGPTALLFFIPHNASPRVSDSSFSLTAFSVNFIAFVYRLGLHFIHQLLEDFYTSIHDRFIHRHETLVSIVLCCHLVNRTVERNYLSPSLVIRKCTLLLKLPRMLLQDMKQNVE